MPPFIISARGAMHAGLKKIGLKLQRLAPNQIRGIEPIADIKFLLGDISSPIIFDVGANDGEVSQIFRETWPTANIFAIEPFKECCDKLSIRFSGQRRIHIENLALGESPGQARLNLYSGNRMNSLLELSDQPDNLMRGFQKTGSTAVQINTLDSFCKSRNIEILDILKIDTQGYDLNVLKGGRGLFEAKRVKIILIEVNFVSMYRHQASFLDLHTFLWESGFRLVAFYNHVWKNGHAAWCDACYVEPSLVVSDGGSPRT